MLKQKVEVKLSSHARFNSDDAEVPAEERRLTRVKETFKNKNEKFNELQIID